MDDVIVVATAQGLRVGPRGGRPDLHRPARRGLRPARAERRGQDDDGRDPRGPPRRAPRARSASLGIDPANGGRDYRERIGIVLQEAGFDEEFTVRELVRTVRVGSTRDAGPRRDDRARRASRTRRDARTQDPVRRPAPSARPRARPRRRPRAALPRRADDRLRPVGAPPRLGPLASLRALGTTILLTTHYMEEARAARRPRGGHRRGPLVAMGTPADLVVAGAARRPSSFTLPPGVGAVDAAAGQGGRPC